MFTQKLSDIFCFFDLDQISDMCNFGMSIGFLPLVRIVWIKQHLFWRFEEKSMHIWWSYFTKCTIFKFPKFHLYMHVSIVEFSLWQPIFEIVRWMWQKLLDKTLPQVFKPYKSYILTSRLHRASWVTWKGQVTCLCLLKNLARYSAFFDLDQISYVLFWCEHRVFGYQRANGNTNLETGTLRGSAQT